MYHPLLGTWLKLSSCERESKVVNSKIWRDRSLCSCNSIVYTYSFKQFKELLELCSARTHADYVKTWHPPKTKLRFVRANIFCSNKKCFSQTHTSIDLKYMSLIFFFSLEPQRLFKNLSLLNAFALSSNVSV